MIASPSPPLACVLAPRLALQVGGRQVSPGDPWAVCGRSGPQAPVLDVDDAARRSGVLPGMRAASARGLCPGLQIVLVDAAALAAAVASITLVVERFSPRVEVSADEPGELWVDPAGMGRLFGPPDAWAAALARDLAGAGWQARVIVGFRRAFLRALARAPAAKLAPGGALVVADLAAEERLAAAAPLVELGLPQRRAAELAALEIRTFGDLLRIPAAELRRRFGPEVAEVAERAGGLDWAPLRPRRRRDPAAAALALDPPEDDQERLLFAIKGGLAPLLAGLAAAGEAAGALDLTLRLDRADPIHLRVEPAAPTLDLLGLLDLVRLRLAAAALAAPIVEIEILVHETRLEGQQEGILAVRPRRDPRAAAAALARLRAAYGEAAVTRPRLRSAHLPEATFSWEPIQELTAARAAAGPAANLSGATPPLCRRLLARPRPLEGDDPAAAPSLRGAEDLAKGPIRRLTGPHRVSGGWWARAVERDYYYAEAAGDELLWLFYDRQRRRWYLHGWVD